MDKSNNVQTQFYAFVQPVLSTLSAAGVIAMATFIFRMNAELKVLKSNMEEVKSEIRSINDESVHHTEFSAYKSFMEYRITAVQRELDRQSGL